TCTGSSRLVDARPVRRPPSSCFSSWIAPCMRRLSSLMSWVGFAMAIPFKHVWSILHARRSLAGVGESLFASICDGGGASLPAQHCRDRSFLPDREHDDRHTVFPGKREGGGVHDLQVAFDRLLMGQAPVAFGVFVLVGVRIVDPVDIGRFEHGFGTDFGR